MMAFSFSISELGWLHFASNLIQAVKLF